MGSEMCIRDSPTDAVRARLSPAARYFAHARIPESAAATLADQEAPAWTYLTGRLHPHASSDIRRARQQTR